MFFGGGKTRSREVGDELKGRCALELLVESSILFAAEPLTACTSLQVLQATEMTPERACRSFRTNESIMILLSSLAQELYTLWVLLSGENCTTGPQKQALGIAVCF